MNAPASHWRALLDQALEAAGGNKQAVADQLDCSRTTVSLVCADKYHGRLDKFAQRVIDAFDGHDCPHQGGRVSNNFCRSIALAPAPTSSAREARHWRACQACPLKPQEIKP